MSTTIHAMGARQGTELLPPQAIPTKEQPATRDQRNLIWWNITRKTPPFGTIRRKIMTIAKKMEIRLQIRGRSVFVCSYGTWISFHVSLTTTVIPTVLHRFWSLLHCFPCPRDNSASLLPLLKRINGVIIVCRFPLASSVPHSSETSYTSRVSGGALHGKWAELHALERQIQRWTTFLHGQRSEDRVRPIVFVLLSCGDLVTAEYSPKEWRHLSVTMEALYQKCEIYAWKTGTCIESSRGTREKCACTPHCALTTRMLQQHTKILEEMEDDIKSAVTIVEFRLSSELAPRSTYIRHNSRLIRHGRYIIVIHVPCSTPNRTDTIPGLRQTDHDTIPVSLVCFARAVPVDKSVVRVPWNAPNQSPGKFEQNSVSLVCSTHIILI